MANEREATEVIRRRYDRVAPVFDALESLMERMSFRRWRELLWSRVGEGKILEVGVGTGKNFPYYPAGTRITAVDFSPAMLRRAQAKATRQNVAVDLLPMDVERLAFPSQTFDAVIGSFVFCSVPNPLQGLREIKRVLRPGGTLILLEHVLSGRPLLRRWMQLVNPLVVRLVGANINRRTVAEVAASGLVLERVSDLSGDIVKLIEARRTD